MKVFRRVNLGTKLVLAFLLMAGLVGIVGYSSFLELKKVLGPLNTDIPQSLAAIERTSHLDNLASKIQDYDHILYDSARDYARQGDRQYKYRYASFEPRLGGSVREAIEKGDAGDKEIFSALEQTRQSLVRLQKESISAADRSDRVEASRILESPEYFRAIQDFRQGLDTYIERRGKEYGESLQLTSSRLDALIMSTHALVEGAIQRLFMISTLAIGLAIGLGLYVSRLILLPIKSLKEGADIIGKGNLDYSISVSSTDEIGTLAEDFNEMTRKLKESYSGLEEKVQEKTGELANKVAEIEDQNKILEMSKSAMLNVLEDLELAKSEIEEERAKDEAILASIGDGMIAVEADGKILKVNKQAEVMLGLSSLEILEHNFHDIVVNEDDKGRRLPGDQNPLDLCLSRGKRVAATAYYVRRDGTRFPAAITVSPILRNNRTVGAIQIFRDITKEIEVDRMKTEFISLASHELRTPLTVIREGVSLVIDEILGPTTDDQRSFLAMVLKDIDRLGRIINNLLDVSKIEAGKVGLKRAFVNLVDITAEVSSAFATLAKSKGLKIQIKVPSKPVEMYVDKDKIVQVFTNLVGNAMKFTEKGHVEMGLREEADQVVGWVSDTGRGISREDMDKVFKKFHQFGGEAAGGEKGTGLGLTIAKGIVEMHHGRIEVESEAGKGTRFVFRIPRETPQSLFQDQLTRGLRDAMNERESLCLAAFSLQKHSGKPSKWVPCLDQAVRELVKASSEQVLSEGETVYAVFSGHTRAELAKIVEKTREIFSRMVLEEDPKASIPELEVKLAAYPDDGSTGEELLSLLSAA